MTYHSNHALPHHPSNKDLKPLGSCIIASHISYPFKEYDLLFSSRAMTQLSHREIKVSQDPIYKLKKLFDELHHFPNVSSISEYYHDTNQIGAQIVFEWINVFSIQYGDYITKGNFIGLEETFSSALNESNEMLSMNGVSYYSSVTRNFFIKVLSNIVKVCLCSKDEEEPDVNSVKVLLILSLCRLEYENASKYIKDLLKQKDNEANIKCLELMNQYVKYQSLKALNDINEVPKDFNHIYSLLKQDYNQILNSDSFSLLFKLIILLKYYSSQDIEQYLKALRNSYSKNSRIEALIISGNSKASITVLENYINNTDDIFAAYFISKFLNSTTQPVPFYQSLEVNFIETLNRLRLFSERLLTIQIINALIDKLTSGRQSSGNSQTEKEYFCYFCETKVVIDKKTPRNEMEEYSDICAKCIGRFHCCSVCRIPIDMEASTKNKYRSMVDIQDNDERLIGSEFKYLWCSRCLHGGHLDEVRKWFFELSVCPQADCSCLCLNYNHILL